MTEDSPLPHTMIKITLFATRIADLRRQVQDMERLSFRTQGNMEIQNTTAVEKGFHYSYIQHMIRKP